MNAGKNKMTVFDEDGAVCEVVIRIACLEQVQPF